MRTHAQRLAVLAVATALGGGTAATARSATWEAIEQIQGRAPLTVEVAGSPRVYFRVSPGTPLTVPVEGPSQLRVTSRIELAGRVDRVVRYTITVSDGSRELEHETTESSLAPQARHPDAGWSVGKSRKLTVDVPRGVRRVVLSATGASLLVRLQRSAPAEGGTPTVSLTPVIASRSVLVSEGEKTIPYYTTQAGSPVHFHVVGPTTLDLLTRLDFDATMRGIQTYRLAVTDKGQPPRTLEFKTTKATTATYTNLGDRVPSKFDRFQLTIGPGLHEVAVSLVSPRRGAAEIHARIPQPQVGREE